MISVEDCNEIIQKIVNHDIIPPEKATAEQLIQWLKGYSQGQDDAIQAIVEIKKKVGGYFENVKQNV